MKLKSFAAMNCSLAQALEVVGDRWTLLILRDAFMGARRFEQFQRSLGIARNVLTDRLRKLVEEGVLERVPPEGGRPEYRLTDLGKELQPALVALTQWGDRHRPNPKGARLTFVDRASGEPIADVAVHNNHGEALSPSEIGARPGPGLR